MPIHFQVWPRTCARTLAVAVATATLAGCATGYPLMPTPLMYRGAEAKPLFVDMPADRQKPSIDLLYVTDRARATSPEDPFPYTADRSRSMAFGSVTVEFGEVPVTWDALVKESTAAERPKPLNLKLGATTELGRFPPIIYEVTRTPTGLTRDSAFMDAHEKAAAGLRAEVARRLADAPRKEVVLYVHGYHNSFQDAAFTMGELCHFLGREFVCVIFTWRQGGTRGLFAGYNVDRESGEFAVEDLKKAIRIIGETPGVERVHLLAHSRGTDVMTTSIAELGIETYITRTTIGKQFKVRNVVLMAPDIDSDVAAARIYKVVSDPDLPYGNKPDPRGHFPPPGMQITMYVSPDDKALTVSQYLFGSLRRLGMTDVGTLNAEEMEQMRRLGVVDMIEVSGGKTDFFGHSYFVSNPAVSSDLITLIRYGIKPGEPGRPLTEIAKPFWRVGPASAPAAAPAAAPPAAPAPDATK